MFLYFPTPKQDTPESLSGKQNIRKKIPGCKTHQMQEALVNSGQMKDGLRTLVGTPLTLSPEVSQWEKPSEASGYHLLLQN